MASVKDLRMHDVAQDIVAKLGDFIDPMYFGEGKGLEYDAQMEDNSPHARRVLVTARDSDGNEKHFEVEVTHVVDWPRVKQG